MADEVAAPRAELIEPMPAPPVPSPARPAPTSERKPRGRPRGSKNKPKPPVVVTRESDAAMRTVVLEVAPGCDVVTAVAAFARRRGVGVSVLCGRGAVAAVTLRLPTSPTIASTVTLHGRFEVLALSGTVMLPSSEAAPVLLQPPPFSVSLAGTGGQVIGGTLAGEMKAADGMVVVAATFGTAEVHRLPAADEEDAGVDDGRGGGPNEEGKPHHQLLPVMVAAGAGAVGAGGYSTGDGFPGLGGGGNGGHVGHYQPQQPEMVFWAQPSSTRGPDQPSTHF